MNVCASFVFKAESKLKHEEIKLLGGFLQKPKTPFFGGPKWYFLKVKLQICVSAFFLADFHKNMNIWAPWNFKKIKTLIQVHQCTRAKILELDF